MIAVRTRGYRVLVEGDSLQMHDGWLEIYRADHLVALFKPGEWIYAYEVPVQ